MVINNRLEQKFAVITGATAGIGKAAASLFAQSGCHLALTGRREERLREFKAALEREYSIEVEVGAFDIRDIESCRTFVDGLSRQVDILLNNAGLAVGTDAIFEGNMNDWETMIDTNIKGLLAMTRFITPGMKERNTGHVINLSSTAGHETYQGGSVYCASKHAVKAITEATKKDLHGSKVRVSMISPGLVETEFSVVRFKGDKNKANNVYEGIQPLTAQDIAEIIHFVASRPPHVNIMDTIIYPVNQSSATMVHRDNA